VGLDIWFAEDIRNALLAANEASAATAAVIAEVGGGPSIGSGQGPSAGSGQSPSTVRQAQGSGQGPSIGSGQGPSIGSGQSPSTLRQAQGSGQSPSTLRQAQGSGQAVTDSTELLAVSLRAYREGYKAALTTVALAFGIAPQAITLRPFDPSTELRAGSAQDRPFDELGTMQAEDKVLEVEAQDATPQRGEEPEVTYLSPELGGG
jgi:hypothetical protein